MSNKGGYKIINLKGQAFVKGTAKTVKGLYALIEETDKPILISGLNLDGSEIDDFYVLFLVKSNKYVGYDIEDITGTTMKVNVFTVTSADALTITEATIGA